MLFLLTTTANGPPPRKDIDRLKEGLERAKAIRGVNDDAGLRLIRELEIFRDRLSRKRSKVVGGDDASENAQVQPHEGIDERLH